MEYDSGDKVNARWYGQDIDPDALDSYNMIFRFFEPWRSKADAAGAKEVTEPETK